MSLSPFRKKTYVGIDIGHHTIKAIQIERTPVAWKITRADSVPTPPNAVKEGVVLELEAVSAAIRQVLKKAHIHATNAVIAVAGGPVVVRNVRIPKMPEATLRKSIKFEAGRYVPSSIEDSFIEFEIIGQSDEANMDVLIVAAPRELVDSRVTACEAAGLEVEVVDIEAFASYRALIEADDRFGWSDQTVALIDIGSERTNVSIISKGIFVMTRSIPQGGKTFTDAFKNYFKLTEEDAEEGKAHLDLRELLQEGTPVENPPLRVLQPHIDELIREIRRSLNYYQSQQTEKGQQDIIKQVILSGGGAKIHGFSEYLGHKMGLEVHRSGIYDNPRFMFAAVEGIGEEGLEWSVASGLAMRPFAKAA